MNNRTLHFLLVLLALGLHSSPVTAAHKKCGKILEQHLGGKRYPLIGTRNSSAQLIDSVWAIYKLTAIEHKTLDKDLLFKFKTASKLTLSPQIPKVLLDKEPKTIPSEALFSLQANVEAALEKSFKLSQQSLRVFGILAHRSALEALGFGIKHYRALLIQKGMDLKLLDLYFPEILEKELVRNATEEMSYAVHLDREHDVPYLAGYAEKNARKIYIDRSLPQKFKSKGGKFLDAAPYLIVHEGVEKALLDFLKFKNRAYLRTHQIAQQPEKAAVEAHGISWQEYHYEFMEPHIDRIWQKALSKVPSDLDLTPYKNEEDFELLERMKQATVTAIDPFTLNGAVVDFKQQATVWSPRPGVIFFYFNKQFDLASLFIRFQEYFESPVFKNKVFTLAEFEVWYRKQKNGEFTYYEEWDGFNFPNTNLEDFYAGAFKDLTQDEKDFLEFLKPFQKSRYYIYAVAQDSWPTTKRHEEAHALYKINPEYRAKVQSLLATYDTSLVREYLLNNSGYHPNVIEDETHSWLMNNAEDLSEAGIDMEPFKNLIEELNALMNRYFN